MDKKQTNQIIKKKIIKQVSVYVGIWLVSSLARKEKREKRNEGFNRRRSKNF